MCLSMCENREMRGPAKHCKQAIIILSRGGAVGWRRGLEVEVEGWGVGGGTGQKLQSGAKDTW